MTEVQEDTNILEEVINDTSIPQDKLYKHQTLTNFRNYFKTKLDNLYYNKDINKFIKEHKISKKVLNQMMTDIEKSVFEWSCSNNITNININLIEQKYKIKAHQIYCNLHPDEYIKNNYLIYKILSNDIEPSKICSLIPPDTFPENWAEILDKKKKIDNIRYTEKEETTTDEYTCKRCKQSKCTYFLRQTRSADESMTTFITCTVCNNHWKI